MINTTEHSETQPKYELDHYAPRVAKFEKVSFEQFKLAFDTLLENYETNGTPKDTCVKEIYDMIELPTRATSGSAGYDFKTPINHTLGVYKSMIIPTGIRCKVQSNYVLQLYPRSSLGFKYGMELINTVGIIDSDYYEADNEGHIMIKIRPTVKQLQLKMGEKFAQGIFLPFGITRDDDVNTKRSGGIGSTGK